MKAYKGFNRDMTCRDFQYEQGKEYQEEKADLCNAGFHVCENPLDCFSYYAPAGSVYREVELDGVSDETSDDTKRVGKKIKIGAEIGLRGVIEGVIKFIFERTDWKNEESTTGDRAGARATGYRAGAQATGDRAGAQATGIMACASAVGIESTAFADGKHAVACAIGEGTKAKGTLGTWLVIVERGEWNGECYPIITVKTGKVDGDAIKPDTWYTLKNGEFVEVND